MKVNKLSAMLKAAGTMFAIVLMCALLPILAYADGKVTVTTQNGANVRSKADTTGVIVASALYNESYDVLATETDSSGATWYKIKVGDKEGYVHGSLVTASGVSQTTTTTTTTTSTPASTEETVPVETEPASGTITTDVNVRAGASTKHQVVAGCKPNDKVTVTGYYFNTDGSKWYRVEFTQNNKSVVGFIKSDFVKLEGELVDKVEEPIEEPVEEPVELPPVVEEPVKVYKDFEAVYDEKGDAWYLEDYTAGTKYKVTDLYDALEKVKVVENESKAALSKKNIVIAILIVIIAAMIIAAGIIFIMFRRWYFDVDETEKPAETKKAVKSSQGTGFISRDDYDDDDDDDDDEEPIKVRHSTSEVSARTVSTPGTVAAAGTTAHTANKPAEPSHPTVSRGLPEGAVKLPDGRIQMPDGTIRRSVVGTRLPDGNIRLGDGRIIRPDGTPVAPAPVKEAPVVKPSEPVKKSSSLDQLFSDDDDMDLSFLNNDSE